MVFNSHFEKIYPVEILFEECCEKYNFYIQWEVEYSSCDELCEDIDERESKDETGSSNENMNEFFSLFIPQEESLPDMIYDCTNDCMVDALYPISYASDVSDLKEDLSPSLQEVPHDIFSPKSEEKDHQIAHFSVQDHGVLDSPIFDKYSDGEEHIPFVDLRSSQLVYDNYELDCAEE